MKVRVTDTAVYYLQKDILWTRLPSSELPRSQMSAVILQDEHTYMRQLKP